MNAPLAFSDEQLQSALDALAAGELEEPVRRRLFAWLDASPGRWKLCALAFLEAQTWEQAFREPLTERVENRPAAVASPAGESSRSPQSEQLAAAGSVWCRNGQAPKSCGTVSRGRPPRRLAAARLAICLASVASVAFLVGAAAGRYTVLPVQARPPLAGETAPDAAPGREVETSEPSPVKDASPAAADPLLATVDVGAGKNASSRWVFRVPVVDAPSAAETAPDELPDYLRRQWRQQGWELQPQRKYLPARLADGSRVMVPVDQIRMQYVGKQVY